MAHNAHQTLKAKKLPVMLVKRLKKLKIELIFFSNFKISQTIASSSPYLVLQIRQRKK